MRKSVLISVVLPIFVSVMALLWLLWAFFPLAVWGKGVATLVLIIVASAVCWQRAGRLLRAAGTASTAHLPPMRQQGAVVLVCGDGVEALFADQPLRETPQGCWLRVGDIGALADVIRTFQLQQPHQLGQLSVMYHCLPDAHQDEAVLRASLKALRQQLTQLRNLTGYPLPLVLNGQFSGPETPWTLVRGDSALVCPVDAVPMLLQDWLQAADNLTRMPILSQAFAFIRDILLDELEKADRLCPPVTPFAVALRSGAPRGDDNSLWSYWLFRRTCLRVPHTPARNEQASRFVDPLLPLLAPLAVPAKGGQTPRRVVVLLWFCALIALGFSVANNRTLIGRVSADLQRWQAIPMAYVEPKAQALLALKQQALLLERWQRQGEPLRYGLGLYTGQRLWLMLQQAIDTYVAPSTPLPPKVENTPQTPQTLRLDSLSLFDTGKAVLKPAGTQVLERTLLNIKAKPGWLIVIAGHTDSTGNAQTNQQLSLKRAEAVRDWLVQSSDLSPTCFAVQGLGASHPVATNETEAGRAANRRVEISLLPQADACQAAGQLSASPTEDGAVTSKMEK